MNIGLKFRDLFSGRLGQAILNELDNLLSGIIAHWQVNHNDDGTHSTIRATGDITADGNISATRITAEAFYGPGIGIEDIPESSIRDDSLLARVAGNETVVGNWAFSTVPTLGTLTGYIKTSSGTINAQSAPLPPADLGSGTPSAGNFLRGDGTWAAAGTSFFYADLGGSRLQAVKGTGSYRVPEGREITLDSTKVGTSMVVRCECITTNVATSVTPRLYNVTDASVVATGSPSTATTWGAAARQSFNATLASGVKVYRLEITPSNGSNNVFALGSLESA